METGRNVGRLLGGRRAHPQHQAQAQASQAGPARLQSGEARKAIGDELVMLLAAGFIKEVQHPDWIANPVFVPKKNGKWRMCVDYTSMNKVCPKDLFLLPRIDQVVDLTVGM
jgi:hypothetical protein